MAQKEKCKGCLFDKYIINRTHMLCDDCNQIRLHGGNRISVEKNKYQARMGKLFEKRKINSVQKKQIKKSKKQTTIDKKYFDVVAELKNEREAFCETCGHTNKPLSISHTISRKRCKEIGREDLITDKDNLIIECFEAPSSNPSACHNVWEVQQLKKYQDINPDMFKKRLTFIKENDLQTFKILLDKIL